MPINIPNNLPAYETLTNENIFVMTEERAVHQDIRPLRIAIFEPHAHQSRYGNATPALNRKHPLQVDVVLLHPKTHVSKNTPAEHLSTFYKTFDDVKNERFDGLIITGAPVELLSFEEVDYWDELTRIMEWSVRNVFSTLYICWGAQAGLYYHYGIPKHPLKEKMFGVFEHRINKKNVKLFRGFDDVFYIPHSRHTEVRREDIEKVHELEILSESDEAGVFIVSAKNGRQIFVTGHSEYDPLTLKYEYERDLARGLPIKTPRNYFPGDNPEKDPVVRWRGHANLLFANWLNYYVYQETPYDLNELE